ncbi:FUSC family protein [Faecalibacter rhinopitheci]|uniref:FUSC family protein n=1 Tax=Faecalibacter rhinopitheci TaxID=2779678 RepID=A0A8J7G4N7_9FLAO|nr:FUSC family membrane protein [Faecalibacter rhinopitheci]MBF0596225.1 FUSC family protein [Faecalibacter rhinopitheci]
MQYKTKIENFLNSEMFSDGLKTSFSLILPPIIFGLFDRIDIGITLSFGVVLTHICDIPGIVKDRRNFMLLAIFLTTVVSFLTRTYSYNSTLVFITLPIITFSMAMLTVYGQRTTNLGMAVMLSYVMSLAIRTTEVDFPPLTHSLFVMAGGIWYMIFSLMVSQFRPYKMAQQALADCMNHIGEYVRIKSKFYDSEIDTEKITQELLEEQILINEKQDLVRELVYKNKKLIKDTTVIGRSLVFIFSDLNDIFESFNATHFDYVKMHDKYGNDEAYRQIYRIGNKISLELKSIAFHINTSRKPKSKFDFDKELNKLKEQINLYNDEDRVFMQNVYLNLKHIVQKINFIHRFFYEKNIKEKKKNPYDHLEKFTTNRDYKLKNITEHLNLKSSIFRHALRLSIVMLMGFSLTFMLPNTSHSYWILMTILVIMKPGFSVTKKRNYQRLLGTVFGGIIGLSVVYFIENKEIKFGIMLVLMIFAYTYLRHKYVIGTLFLTAYILISFSFLTEYNSFEIIGERLADTFIGGSLAFISSYIILPSWESKNINTTIQKALIANYNFLFYIFYYVIYRDVNMTKYKLARKNVYVNMANVTSIFQRVISEPKKTQINAKELNRFTIFNHSFVSYSIGIIELMQRKKNIIVRVEHIDLMVKILQQLHTVILIFGEYEKTFSPKDLMKEYQMPILYQEKEDNQPDLIMELLELVEEIVFDLGKVSKKMNW